MRTCRYTGFDCTQPHLKCRACEVMREARKSDKDLLVPARIRYNGVLPYIKFVKTKDGPGIEIGVKGTF